MAAVSILNSGLLSVGFGLRMLAVLLAGFGGLVIEVVALRRQALVLGSSAEASAAVLAVFMLGLGVGGVWVSRSRRLRGEPGRQAGRLYLAAGLLALGGDLLLRQLGTLSGPMAVVAVVLQPGLAAVAMGAAFPLLFSSLSDRGGIGLLVGFNLCGSVVAAWAAPNLLIPGLGLSTSLWIGVVAYALAAVAVRLSGLAVEALEPTGRPARLGYAGRAALVSGLIVVGAEVLMLRRLPFFLEGFQPTLGGVLATCLLGLALGAVIGPPLFRALAGSRAAAVATLVGGLLLCLGLHEHAPPLLSRMRVDSEAGMHLRVLVSAAVAVGPTMLALGAVLPLALASFPKEERAAAAGELFFWQGVGGLLGAVLIGHVLPWLWPGGMFAAAPVLLALFAVQGMGRALSPRWRFIGISLVLLAGLLGFAGAGTLWEPAPPVRGSRWDKPEIYRPVAWRSDAVCTASVVYDRSAHSMVLFTDWFRAAYTGPETSYMKVLGHLPFLLRDDLRDVAVIALGTGTTADAVCAWPSPRRIEVVEISSAVLDLVDHFAGDGPVATGLQAAFRRDPRSVEHCADGRHWLAAQPEDSLDLVTMEPLLPYAPGTANLYSAEFYALAKSRLRDDGLFVQWVPTHAMPTAMFDTLLATFGDAFPEVSLWLVDQSTLMVGSTRPHLSDPEVLARRLAAAPAVAATTMHEAGLAGGDDLLAAYLASGPALRELLVDAERLVDDRPSVERIGYWSGGQKLSFYADNLARLAELCALEPTDRFGDDEWSAVRIARLGGLAARSLVVLDRSGEQAALAVGAAATLRPLAPESVLLWQEEGRALRALVELEALRSGARVTAGAARRQIERDPGAALLQAIAAGDRPEAEARSAVARATALDPGVVGRLPADLARLAPPPDQRRSPLEDLSSLPEGEPLAELAARNDSRGLAVRAAFPVRCAVALIEVASVRPLREAERRALRTICDPASFAEYSGVCAGRGGDVAGEVLPLWRGDLPGSAEIVSLADGPLEQRLALGEALIGRRGAAERELLGRLMLDQERQVRLAAAAVLARSFGEQISYDPDGSRASQEKAVQQLRSMHNRRP